MKNAAHLAVIAALALPGCATRDYVHEYVQGQLKPLSARVGAVEGRTGEAEAAIKANAAASAAALAETQTAVAEIQVTLKVHGDRIARNEGDIAQLSRTAQEAVERANEAGRLARGKMVYEVVLSEDKLKFDTGKATLDERARSALDAFGADLKADDAGVYVEIQGHTDSRGEAAANLALGEARAEAVRRHLNQHGGIPLHRMSVVSYGESAPIADNHTRAGRQQNRRVVLVVIK